MKCYFSFRFYQSVWDFFEYWKDKHLLCLCLSNQLFSGGSIEEIVQSDEYMRCALMSTSDATIIICFIYPFFSESVSVPAIFSVYCCISSPFHKFEYIYVMCGWVYFTFKKQLKWTFFISLLLIIFDFWTSDNRAWMFDCTMIARILFFLIVIFGSLVTM